jgi:hypothetical protein
VTVALRLWGARAASLQLPAACRQRSATFTTDYAPAIVSASCRDLQAGSLCSQKIARTLQFPGSARVSRVGDDVSSSQTFLKIVSARRRNQHARRVRYPELLLNSCEELVRRDSVEPGELTAPQSVALPFNARKQWDWFPNDMSVRQLAPFRVIKAKSFFFSAQFHLPIQLIKNPVCRFRRYRRNQNRDDAH